MIYFKRYKENWKCKLINAEKSLGTYEESKGEYEKEL